MPTMPNFKQPVGRHWTQSWEGPCLTSPQTGSSTPTLLRSLSKLNTVRGRVKICTQVTWFLSYSFNHWELHLWCPREGTKWVGSCPEGQMRWGVWCARTTLSACCVGGPPRPSFYFVLLLYRPLDSVAPDVRCHGYTTARFLMQNKRC